MRGVIGYLVRQGRELLSSILHTEATEHVIRHMSITDPEEQTFVSQIVGEQQAAMGIASQLSQSTAVPTVDAIPTSITIPLGTPGKVQYMVIAEVRNTQTGETVDIPITMYDDITLSSGEVFSRAQDAVTIGLYPERYKTRIQPEQAETVTEFRLISVSRRA